MAWRVNLYKRQSGGKALVGTFGNYRTEAIARDEAEALRGLAGRGITASVERSEPGEKWLRLWNPYTGRALIYQEVIEKPPFTPVYVDSVLVTDGTDGREEHVESWWYHEGRPKSLKGPFGSAAMTRRRIQAGRAKRNPPTKSPTKTQWTVRTKVGKEQWRRAAWVGSLAIAREVAKTLRRRASSQESIAVFKGAKLHHIIHKPKKNPWNTVYRVYTRSQGRPPEHQAARSTLAEAKEYLSDFVADYWWLWVNGEISIFKDTDEPTPFSQQSGTTPRGKRVTPWKNILKLAESQGNVLGFWLDSDNPWDSGHFTFFARTGKRSFAYGWGHLTKGWELGETHELHDVSLKEAKEVFNRETGKTV